MRFGVLLVCLAGCFGAEIGDSRGSQSSSTDAGGIGIPMVDAGPTTTTQDGGTPFLAQCMAKGYTASGTLTSLYRVVATDAKWADAEAACNGDVAGATHLVVLSSSTEVDTIKTTRGWIGLSDKATEGTFVNVTKEPNDQRPFLNGQPDNGSGDENCVQMKPNGLDDDQCAEGHTYVCECDGKPPA